jgi:hypothetical protein
MSPPEPTAQERDLALRRYDTVMKYLGTETQIYWTRSQLFLVANAALLGFEVSNVPVAPDARISKLIALLIGASTGGVLCFLWRKGLRSGEGWMDHWKSALIQWEELAFETVNLYRKPPACVPKSTSGTAKAAAWLFSTLWWLIAAYLVGCLVLRLAGRNPGTDGTFTGFLR